MHPLIKQFRFLPGVETHTFTAIGRCPRTGRMGISVSTGELAVGSRVPFVKPNIGVVATQALTDPRLGTLAIQLLELGYVYSSGQTISTPCSSTIQRTSKTHCGRGAPSMSCTR